MYAAKTKVSFCFVGEWLECFTIQQEFYIIDIGGNLYDRQQNLSCA
ncbi:hypothetical protein BFV96_3587 [Alteromonas macleodii]|uniref:Uncharacterized protein n=1 Tax=Alteromonas macleodii TaxID=28108 RepID=A0AB36FV71_ALTMA|nr:hypothetical protein BFV93_3594 [Alteromonas macleodii]OES28215.1 hypothetical protein BFV95_3604 [Alteromonas macleodii]OES39821.1 hypothetical protein BFV96_3587 [Alteromonas macleodii]